MTNTQKPHVNAPAASSERTETAQEAKGRAALRPEVNSLLVIDAFKKDVMGEDADIRMMMDNLEGSINEIKVGDLSHLEAMLLSQATTLQTLFTSFALKASRQQHLPNHQIFMTMAFKAQAQSRATLQTLVDLKCPKQPTFVKQANIAHGAQQVNNGVEPPTHDSHAKSAGIEKNELLKDRNDQANGMDARASGTTGRANPSMATVGPLHRPQKHRR